MKVAIVGLDFGDEGKGKNTDLLSSVFNIQNIVRYNGGCQAAHNVHIGPIHHVFSQFGSASFLGANTILSNFMLLEPKRLLVEADFLIKKVQTDILNRINISENCTVIVPVHRLINQLKELSRVIPNGSVGLGVGEAVSDSERGLSIKIKDLLDPKQASFKLKEIWAWKMDLAEQLVELHRKNQEMSKLFNHFLETESVEKTLSIYQLFVEELSNKIISDEKIKQLINQNEVIFEGAQGTLLDQNYGFRPHVTWSNTTIVNIKELTDEKIHTIGLTRAYSTRHGPGPFPTEDDLSIIGDDNHFNQWQKNFRYGWLDLVLLQYAIKANQKIDSVGLTCIDNLTSKKEIKICTYYLYQGNDLESAHRCFEYDKANPRKLLNLKLEHPRTEIISVLESCTPIYQSFPSWKTNDFINSDDLPTELKEYIKFIEEHIGVPISLISFGKDRQEKLFLKEITNTTIPSNFD